MKWHNVGDVIKQLSILLVMYCVLRQRVLYGIIGLLHAPMPPRSDGRLAAGQADTQRTRTRLTDGHAMLSKVQTLYNCSRHIKIECVLIECVHVFQTVPHYVWQHRVPPVLKKPFRLWEKTQKCTYLFMPLRLCVQQLIQGEALVRHDVAPWRVVGTP